MKTAIIGAGAAGCFAAIEIKRQCPDAEVVVIEKGRKALAKVAITGGGRCNLTNSFAEVRSLEQVYPRGHRLMKKLLHHFSHTDTMRWFENEGVRLVTQDDQCVFPQSQNAMEIVDTLLRLMRNLGVRMILGTKAEKIIAEGDGTYTIVTSSGTDAREERSSFDICLVTTGGYPTPSGYSLLDTLSLDITPPLPSLFSLCIDDKSLLSLMGTVVENAIVSIPGTKLRSQGALLLTHWGISGPATLKLSSYAAPLLAEKDYLTDVAIQWLGGMPHEEIAEHIRTLRDEHPNKHLSSVYHPSLNARLWQHILLRAHLSPDTRWKDLNQKDFNRLHNTLTNDTYHVTGKNRFKDEFVTCGGVALSCLNTKTLESKSHPRLFFAGEVTDVDAITGGFNLQAAWTMGYVAAHGIATTCHSKDSVVCL